MANRLIIQNVYTPRPGEGGALRSALQLQNEVWLRNGQPGFQLLKPYDGIHHTYVTVQEWDSFQQWDETRHDVPKIEECRAVVFDRIYPTTLHGYSTTMFEEIR